MGCSMKFCIGIFLFSIQCIHATFYEIESPQELQQKLRAQKECIVAIGIEPCIPCDKLKKKLLQDQAKLPDIFWIDLKNHPKIRHVFPFKAVPYMAIYQDGDVFTNLTGEKNCRDYLINIQYSEQK